jgi:probable HAF family extracellular repeat protein/parallel beta-helix repeat protein
MAFSKLSKWWQKRPAERRVRSCRRTARLRLEQLEDRCVPGYTITDLGALGGNGSAAYGINASGQVVGFASFGSYEHAFLYSAGVMKDLGTLAGPDSNARGINDLGDVVGGSSFDATGAPLHAFHYSGGHMADLGTLGSPRQFGSQAFAINSSGQVVGGAFTATGRFHPFLYSGGQMIDLGSLGADSFATVINASGQVAGTFETNRDGAHGFLYSGGVMTDLGNLGGAPTYAYGINSTGQVVGTSNGHPFLYSAGAMTALGGLGTEGVAYGINSAGQVVGITRGRPFLYSAGTVTDLSSLLPANSGWRLLEARAINDSGQIVGAGTNPQGQTHAFLLTPPNTLTVTDAAAESDGTAQNPTGSDGKLSLQEAIAASQRDTSPDNINFAIGTATITLSSALPAITANPVTIDGGGTVVIDGSMAAGTATPGIDLEVDGCTVRGLTVQGFTGSGIKVASNNNFIQGNTLTANGCDGILIAGGSNNTIGGTTSGTYNVITLNSQNGVHLDAGATSKLVVGDYIGTDTTTLVAKGNHASGVAITGASKNNTVGDTSLAALNVISGNGGSGVFISGGSSGNLVAGNRLGTNFPGTAAVGNGAYGVFIVNSPRNTVGGTAAGAGNLISGNRAGVGLTGSGTVGNLVQGNLIGTNAGGARVVGARPPASWPATAPPPIFSAGRTRGRATPSPAARRASSSRTAPARATSSRATSSAPTRKGLGPSGTTPAWRSTAQTPSSAGLLRRPGTSSPATARTGSSSPAVPPRATWSRAT